MTVKTMTVKTATDHVDQITNICDRLADFYENHPELENELGCLFDAVAFLEDYKKVLLKAIDEAEINL
jgi:hypothetical protein